MEPRSGYRLTRFIGRGGFGEVWQATGPTGKPLALKFLPCHNPGSATKEIRALQVVGQLRHPYLLQIQDIWCAKDAIILVMDLAEGSLLDLYNVYQSELGEPIIPQHLCHFLGQAAQALDFLNTRQHMVDGQRVAVRHCDINPTNLLVLDGNVKVADFSLAVWTTSEMWYQRRTGTLAYAAPEVFKGYLSQWSDQYALAVTYCQLRTGHLPFNNTPATFQTGYTRPTPDLTGLGPREQRVLLRALDPVPQARWPTSVEMIERIAQSLEQDKHRTRSRKLPRLVGRAG